MMQLKRITLFLMTMVAACQNEPTPPNPQGNLFEFRKMVAMHTTLDDAREMDQFATCDRDPNDDSTTCEFAKSEIAGVDVSNSRAQFVEGKFDNLEVGLPSYNYEPLRDALIKIYGSPCKGEAAVEADRKQMGKVIRGREVQWCFDNGFLALMEEARHGSVDGSELEFLSNRETSGEPDYNASTL